MILLPAGAGQGETMSFTSNNYGAPGSAFGISSGGDDESRIAKNRRKSIIATAVPGVCSREHPS